MHPSARLKGKLLLDILDGFLLQLKDVFLSAWDGGLEVQRADNHMIEDPLGIFSLVSICNTTTLKLKFVRLKCHARDHSK